MSQEEGGRILGERSSLSSRKDTSHAAKKKSVGEREN